MIFISHKHLNQDIAEKLVDFIVATVSISRDRIRCTSTPGSQLPVGQSIEAQIKEDLSKAQVVIALLTKESKNAHWVLFELGAAWVLGKLIVPILAADLTNTDLPGPLPNYPCVFIGRPETSSWMIDAMRQVAQMLNTEFDFDGNAQRKLDEFLKSFALVEDEGIHPGPSVDSPPSLLQAKLFLLGNDLFLLYAHSEEKSGIRLDNPQFFVDRDEAILEELGINLGRSLWFSDLEDLHTLLNKLNAKISVRYPRERTYFAAGWDFPTALFNRDFASAQDLLSQISYPDPLPENVQPEQIALIASSVREYFEKALSQPHIGE